jgi:hypothetical protein
LIQNKTEGPVDPKIEIPRLNVFVVCFDTDEARLDVLSVNDIDLHVELFNSSDAEIIAVSGPSVNGSTRLEDPKDPNLSLKIDPDARLEDPKDPDPSLKIDPDVETDLMNGGILLRYILQSFQREMRLHY